MDRLDSYWIEQGGTEPDGVYEMEANALETNRVNSPHTDGSRKGLMSDIKQQIERHEYKVDSQRVAEEMIKRMRLAGWARSALVSDAAGTPGRPATAS